MAETLKPQMKLQDETFQYANIPQYNLSIQITSQSFCYSILDKTQNKNIVFEKYNLPEISYNNDFCEHLESLINRHEYIKQPFYSTMIIVDNPGSTLIPAGLFDETKMNDYFLFNNILAEDEIILSDKLHHLDAYNIYSLPEMLVNKLKQLFPSGRILHYASSLMEELFIKNKNKDSGNTIYVNVQPAHFEVMIFRDNKLFFFNSFQYKTAEDFIYYLLFVAEQMKMNPETFELILLGEIERSSAIFDLLFKYVRNIKFCNRNDSFAYSYVFNEIPDHFYYNLLNLNLCV